MSDTPLTDAALKDWSVIGKVPTQVVTVDFARQLERRLHQLNVLLREAHGFLNAQAYTQEEMDDFCRRLDDHFGIESDR